MTQSSRFQFDSLNPVDALNTIERTLSQGIAFEKPMEAQKAATIFKSVFNTVDGSGVAIVQRLYRMADNIAGRPLNSETNKYSIGGITFNSAAAFLATLTRISSLALAIFSASAAVIIGVPAAFIANIIKSPVPVTTAAETDDNNIAKRLEAAASRLNTIEDSMSTTLSRQEEDIRNRNLMSRMTGIMEATSNRLKTVEDTVNIQNANLMGKTLNVMESTIHRVQAVENAVCDAVTGQNAKLIRMLSLNIAEETSKPALERSLQFIEILVPTRRDAEGQEVLKGLREDEVAARQTRHALRARIAHIDAGSTAKIAKSVLSGVVKGTIGVLAVAGTVLGTNSLNLLRECCYEHFLPRGRRPV